MPQKQNRHLHKRKKRISSARSRREQGQQFMVIFGAGVVRMLGNRMIDVDYACE